MGKQRQVPEVADDDLLADYARIKANLREGGPDVDCALLEDFEDGALDPRTRKVVLQNVTTYRKWSDALFKLETTTPELVGPTVDEQLMVLYLTGRLSSAAEVPVRRNIRLYRNWYEAACREV